MSADFLKLNRSANKQLNKLPLKIHEKVIVALDSIKINPLIGPRLSGELAGYHKFRIGDYRIVYKFDPKESLVEVVKVERRGGVYR